MIPFCKVVKELVLDVKEHPHPSPLPSRERGWSIARSERGLGRGEGHHWIVAAGWSEVRDKTLGMDAGS